MGRTEFLTCNLIASEPWLDRHIFNESEMALFSECMPQCARKCLTPPTLLSRWEKSGRGGTEDETVKLLDGIQRV
jgi:hypothetical protein